MIDRRTFLARTAGLVMLGVGGRQTWLHAFAEAAPPVMTIYKSPSCGCCVKWVEHIKASGFKVVVHDEEDMDEVKKNLGVPDVVHSCHTAQVGRYLIEGHVPAGDVKQLLAKPVKVAGLAVPGMPTGTPGMAMPGKPAESYDVVSFQLDGSTKLFARH